MSGVEHNADWVPVKQRLCCWGVGLQHESRWVVSLVVSFVESRNRIMSWKNIGVAGKK